MYGLTIVIPALDEEEAIAATISRCLAARDSLRVISHIDEVKIIVVSDGSTDRTEEIARGFGEITLLVFERNRGYGAALKEGFRMADTTLVGFLDADGTCDPADFAVMCRLAVEGSLDIVVGSRLGPGSRMPLARRIGNRLFAIAIGMACSHHVTDAASGMRVLRRDALSRLYPLPDGLEFTPSMSTRALLGGLRVAEIPIRYAARLGRSKLSLVRDGARFLAAILDGLLCYGPERLFFLGFWWCLVAGLALALYPLEYYLRTQSLLDWMIYRVVACSLLGSAGHLLLCAGVLSHRMHLLVPHRRAGSSFWAPIVAKSFEVQGIAVFLFASVSASLAVLWPGIWEYLGTGHVTLHWSRLLVGSFGLLLSFQTCVTGVLLKVVAVWQRQHAERGGIEEVVAAPHGPVRGTTLTPIS